MTVVNVSDTKRVRSSSDSPIRRRRENASSRATSPSNGTAVGVGSGRWRVGGGGRAGGRCLRSRYCFGCGNSISFDDRRDLSKKFPPSLDETRRSTATASPGRRFMPAKSCKSIWGWSVGCLLSPPLSRAARPLSRLAQRASRRDGSRITSCRFCIGELTSRINSRYCRTRGQRRRHLYRREQPEQECPFHRRTWINFCQFYEAIRVVAELLSPVGDRFSDRAATISESRSKDSNGAAATAAETNTGVAALSAVKGSRKVGGDEVVATLAKTRLIPLVKVRTSKTLQQKREEPEWRLQTARFVLLIASCSESTELLRTCATYLHNISTAWTFLQ